MDLGFEIEMALFLSTPLRAPFGPKPFVGLYGARCLAGSVVLAATRGGLMALWCLLPRGLMASGQVRTPEHPHGFLGPRRPLLGWFLFRLEFHF